MRETLIRRQSSGIGASAHFRTDRGSPFVRRTDAIAYGSCYQKAAALVDLAEDGVGLPEQILDQSTFANSASLYFCYIRFDFIWTTNLFALILLNFLEKPLWCIKGDGVDSCKNREFYFLGQLPYLTIPESFILEAACLLVLVMHTLFPIAYEGISLYWKNTVNRVKLIAILIMIADLIVYSISIPRVPSLPFRIAPYIRVMFFISDIKGLRASIVLLYGMVWTYVNVLALGFLFILFSSWLAYVIFEDTLQGKTVFTSYGSTLYQMYILFTTSNNPDVWIPAYKASRWNVIFVILYVLLGVYFVTNLILAVVYESFKTQLVKQVDRTDSQRKRILKKAFTIIDDSDVGFLNKNQCVRLFEEMNKYRTLPSISREDFELIFDALDDSHDFQINLREFTDLCHAIALRFRKEDVPSFLEDYPSVYRSRLSERVKSFVRGSEFGYLVVIILILNLVTVIVETTLDVENSSAQKSWQALEFVFGWLYVVEMCLKVYALGFENYWSGGMNRFDFTVTVIIVLGETMTFASPTALSFISDGEWIRYLILARLLRLTRILMHVRRYRAFTATFLGLIPSLLPYLGLIFCVMCVYCSLGLQVFGGIVSAGNPRIAETDLANNDYLLFNFNDYPNGMVTLFNLLVMGNWHVWMESYEELTGSPWTITYFISFYLVGVLLLLNLVVAFVLEAFVAEMELQEEDGGDAGMDAAGENRRRRVCVGSKTKSNRIDVLLHHMLSAELGRREFSPP